MKTMHPAISVAALALAGGLLTACDTDEGPMEEAAEETSQAVERAADATSEAAEKAGDRIESATD